MGASCSLLWDVIACPCLGCLPLAAGSSYVTRASANAVLDLNIKPKTKQSAKSADIWCTWTVVEGATGHLSQPLTN